MNAETEQLLSAVVEKQQRSISAGECPAMVVLGGAHPLTLTDYDYLRDERTASAFEQSAADKVIEGGADRWVISVPQVWLISPSVISVRAVSNLPLRPGESEAITWMSFDLHDGIDYGRVPFTRRPDGTPVFGDIEIIARAASPAEGMPGYAMLRRIISDENPDTLQ